MLPDNLLNAVNMILNEAFQSMDCNTLEQDSVGGFELLTPSMDSDVATKVASSMVEMITWQVAGLEWCQPVSLPHCQWDSG